MPPVTLLSQPSTVFIDTIELDCTIKETHTAEVEVTDPKGSPLKIEWQLFREQSNYGVQGTGAAATASYPDAIEKNGDELQAEGADSFDKSWNELLAQIGSKSAAMAH